MIPRSTFARLFTTVTAKTEFSIPIPCFISLPRFIFLFKPLTSLFLSPWPSSPPLNLSAHPIPSFHSNMPPESANPDTLILLSPPPSLPETLESSFPIAIISIIGILATAILLLSYYAFVTNRCRNWRQFSSINRLHRTLRRHREDLLSLHSDAARSRGLDELAIQGIPTFRYRRDQSQLCSNECSVCLNDFQEEERVRLLPNCLHVFHIDCIDAWLPMNANCPLCRTEIAGTPLIPANSVTELAVEREEDDDDVRTIHENGNGGRERKLANVFSMGDECIDVRNRGGGFGLQLMRRSFSMDSSNDRQLCIAVQEILRKNSDMRMAGGEEGSSSTGTFGRVRRSFFSLGHYGSLKNSVLPIENEV